MNDPILSQINLYDVSLRKELDPWTLRNTALVIMVSMLLMASWSSWVQVRKGTLVTDEAQTGEQLQAARKEIKALSDRVAGHKTDMILASQLQAAKTRLAAHGEVLEVLKKGLAPDTIRPSDVLRGFANRVPQGLWLTGFKLDMKTGLLEISGRTTTPILIPAYATRLGEEKAFVGRSFAALEITDAKQKPAFHEFRLSSKLPEGGGS